MSKQELIFEIPEEMEEKIKFLRDFNPTGNYDVISLEQFDSDLKKYEEAKSAISTLARLSFFTLLRAINYDKGKLEFCLTIERK